FGGRSSLVAVAVSQKRRNSVIGILRNQHVTRMRPRVLKLHRPTLRAIEFAKDIISGLGYHALILSAIGRHRQRDLNGYPRKLTHAASKLDRGQERCYCENMKNITVSLDDQTYRRARIKAAELDTSVSALVRKYLIELAGQETD